MQGAIADEFVASAEWLTVLAGHIDPDAWERPGLGSWNVRSLLGHAARALVTVEEYIAHPAEQIDVPSAVDYLARSARTDPAAIAARGIAAGEALGSDPATYVSELTTRVSKLIAATGPEALLETIGGGMALSTYLPTRTVELIIHGCDLALAIDVDLEPPSDAAASVARLLTEAYIATGRATSLCLVLGGRPADHGLLSLWPSS